MSLKNCNNISAFFALVRAGLWEQDVQLLPYGDIKWSEIYRLATEQSVLGLVLAGLEHSDVKPSQVLLLQWIGEVQVIEQRNTAMNKFVAELIDRLRKEEVYCLLIKGQGVAQCYERPLWRSSGDVDFLLSKDNYDKAKFFLLRCATSSETEYEYEQHLGLNLDPWTVELHGTLRCGLSLRIDKVLDDIQNELFYGGYVRSWINNKTQIFLPEQNADALYVFTHILQHFYRGGIGLRQICDWVRLLWKYKEVIDLRLIEKRLKMMGLLSEWKAFGAFAVEYLGMPHTSLPLFSLSQKWKRKAFKICKFVIEVGNFGHNRDSSYLHMTYLKRKALSFTRRCGDLLRHAIIFPFDSLRFFPIIMFNGIRSAVRGE